MNISIRHWLAEKNIEISQLRGLSTGQIAGVAFRIAEDMEVKSLMPFDLCTFVEVLEQPLSAAWSEITVYTRLTESLLCQLSQKKPLKRSEGTWLAFQTAYLLALQTTLQQEINLRRLWLNKALFWNHDEKVQSQESRFKSPKFEISPPDFFLQNTQLQAILATLRPVRLSDTQAEQALSLVEESLLVQQMNNATNAWLSANGTEEMEAKLITQRLTNSLQGYLLAVVTENAAPLAQLQKFVRIGNLLPGRASSNGYSYSDRIDREKEFLRASLLKSLGKPLFQEFFSLKDIYIPLKGLPQEESIREDGTLNFGSIDLMTWVLQQLEDLETITVIESEPGYGKTSFCQIFATEVARGIYPRWMPIFIRLREIKWGNSLAETLDSAFNFQGGINVSTWLESESLRCLLILDGLDELPPCTQGKMTKAIFLSQLLRFQSECRHKIILTTRGQTLQSIPKEQVFQLRSISIQPLEKDELKLWFGQWAKVQSLSIAQNFFNFLKQEGLFSSAKSNIPELATLVRQPLMLYLLAILHKEGLFDEQILALSNNTRKKIKVCIKWEIYYRLNQWLLGYSLTNGIKNISLRSGSAHIHRTKEEIASLLRGKSPQECLEQMQKSALQILHSQRGYIDLNSNLERLNSITEFYFNSSQTRLKIEFSHSVLGDFLCADAIVAQLKLVSQRISDLYGNTNFVIDSPSILAQHIYNLLGYGLISEELEEFIIAGLLQQSNKQFNLEIICFRLVHFWHDYCRGRWLDEGIARNAVSHFQALQNPVNVEQVNATVGFNIFLLLCAVNRKSKISFLPCGNPASTVEFKPQALSMLIGRTTVLEKNAFYERVRNNTLPGINLSGAYLPQIMLKKANLAQIILSDADLTGANLASANLAGANLVEANLTDANLMGANLSNANLSGANLTGANLIGVSLHLVNLTNTCLYNAILAEADKEIALLNGAMFSLDQFQSLKRLLSQSHHTNIDKTISNESTAAWLSNINATSLLPEIGFIESVEGEPIVSMDVYENYTDGETVLGQYEE